MRAWAPACRIPHSRLQWPDVVGSGRSGGKVLAAFQMSADTGAIIGPILAGVLADTLGYTWAFAVTGALVLAASRLIRLTARETLAPEMRMARMRSSRTTIEE